MINNSELEQALKKTVVVNVLGAPSTGKSTLAAGLFYNLKTSGYNVELITEYAKELVYQEHFNVLGNQGYIINKQINKQYRLLGKVDVIVTDSPILLGSLYRGFGCTESFDSWLLEVFNLFHNVNYLLVPDDDTPYQESGRYQNKEESFIGVHNQIINLLENNKIEHKSFSAMREDTLSLLSTNVKDYLEKNRIGKWK